eukprot:2425613-Pyramimonas_sp.AAC.1
MTSSKTGTMNREVVGAATDVDLELLEGAGPKRPEMSSPSKMAGRLAVDKVARGVPCQMTPATPPSDPPFHHRLEGRIHMALKRMASDIKAEDRKPLGSHKAANAPAGR